MAREANPMRAEVRLIAESFFRTNTMDWDRAVALAGLAVTLYEKHNPQFIAKQIRVHPTQLIANDQLEVKP